MHSFLIGVAFVFFPVLLQAKSHLKIRPKPKSVATVHWSVLARKVGTSEEGRDEAIRALRRIPTLNAELRQALKTNERPLALEVIGALNLQSLLPDLISLVPDDPDGFTALAVNGMMNQKNSPHILKVYADLLQSRFSSLSEPTVVALMEPLGRMNVKLPRPTLLKMTSHRSPDLRAAALYYLRVMALRNGVYNHLDLITEMTRAPELQLRLQAISILAELLARSDNLRLSAHTNALRSQEELTALCLREAGSRNKESCLALLATNVAVQR